MKSVLLYLSLLITFQCEANAESKSLSGEMMACGDIERTLIDSIEKNKEIPKSWDDFLDIQMMKKGSLPLEAYRINILNSFALVPGAPLLKEQADISRSYVGNRLFLISREETSIRTGERGRCFILIKPEDLDSKPIRTFSYFVPEREAQLILKQIPEFDPKKQPVAFDNFFIYQNRKTIKGNQLKGLISKLENARPFDPDHPNALPAPSISTSEWIAGVIVIILGISVYLLKRFKQ